MSNVAWWCTDHFRNLERKMFKFQFERYLFECKTKTKASTTANKNKGKYHNEPMEIEGLWGILNFFKEENSVPLSPPLSSWLPI